MPETPLAEPNRFAADEADETMSVSTSGRSTYPEHGRIFDFWDNCADDYQDDPDVREAAARWLNTPWDSFEKLKEIFKDDWRAVLPIICKRFVDMEARLMMMDKMLLRTGLCIKVLEDVTCKLSDEQEEERRESHKSASASPATEEDDKLLLRGVSAERLEQLQKGDTVWLGKACAGYRCSWQSPDGSWCVVVEINPHERSVFLRGAKQLKAEEGIIITPYLTAWGMELRRERMAVFKSLQGKGLNPKWHGGVGIRYVKDGVVEDYTF